MALLFLRLLGGAGLLTKVALTVMVTGGEGLLCEIIINQAIMPKWKTIDGAVQKVKCYAEERGKLYFVLAMMKVSSWYRQYVETRRASSGDGESRQEERKQQ